ncbi:carbohydrate kinase family protein [Candidatus Saccharibacteria bacterium]|nr:carbohydrate kinase family protein [Candidatus Saccharibacteria bacterium]
MKQQGPEIKVSVLGAGSLDGFCIVDNFVRDPNVKDKNDLPADQALTLQDDPDIAEFHVGGNGLNSAVRMAAEDGFSVQFGCVVGDDDFVSAAILRRIKEAGIECGAKIVRGYQPSAAKIILPRITLPDGRKVIGNRIIFNGKRDSMEPHWQAADIRELAKGCNAFMLASLKSHKLNERVLHEVEAPLHALFGSSEFRKYPKALREMLERRLAEGRPVEHLSLNDDEIHELFEDEDADTRTLVERAAGSLATHVTCTLGADGLYIAKDNIVEHIEGIEIDPALIKDTTGAGDRTFARISMGIMRGEDLAAATMSAQEEAVQLIQKFGAHGDLHSPVLKRHELLLSAS